MTDAERTLPEHCELCVSVGGARRTQKGAGRTFFLRYDDHLEISGEASWEMMEAVIDSGFLAGVRSAHIHSSCAMKGLPESVGELRALRIESPIFEDWQSIYALGTLEELTLGGGSQGELPEGIRRLVALRKLKVTAKGISTLPGDLGRLRGLTSVKAHAGLRQALREHARSIPKLLFDRKFGFSSRGKRLLVSAPAEEQDLALLVDSGLLDSVEELELGSSCAITSLPYSLGRLPLRALSVKSCFFQDWGSVYGLSELRSLVLAGKAQAALPRGIAKLQQLEHLQVTSQGVTCLPEDLCELDSLKTLKLHPGLKGARQELELSRQARRMRGLLARFEVWLGEHAPDYLAQLQPGLGRQALVEVEASLGFALPPVVQALYAWRDGDAGDDGRFVFLRRFLTLERACETWRELGEMRRSGEWEDAHGVQPPSVWSESWFPIFAWDNGLYRCVDLEGTYKGQRGQVLEVWMKDSDRVIVAPDLPAWFEGFLEALESGQIVETPQGWDWSDASRGVAPPGFRQPLSGYPIRKSSRSRC